ncbi:MAG: metalloregulator ArsR/SmtB family transcription factor [Burkholderiaceae bacterium]
MQTEQHLCRAFGALADRTRRDILARLAAGEATVMQLAAPFDISQPSISKHLKVLEGAGLISRGRAAQTRPCRIEPAPLREIAQWLGPYRRIWEDSFEKLDALLQVPPQTPSQGKKHADKK